MDFIANALDAKRRERESDVVAKRIVLDNALRERMGAEAYAEVLEPAKATSRECDLIDRFHRVYDINHDSIGSFLIEAECDRLNIPHLCIIQGRNVLHFYNEHEFRECLYLLTQLDALPPERRTALRHEEKRGQQTYQVRRETVGG